uniref:Uncharacterized protein n=1 Tax=Amphimedon queenslandica TaxID=400682 RepID=A0A1X7U8F5_AMPQE
MIKVLTSAPSSSGAPGAPSIATFARMMQDLPDLLGVLVHHHNLVVQQVPMKESCLQFRSGNCWGAVAMPQVYSTIALFNGQVLSLGGWDNQPSLSIHSMNVDPRTRQITSWSPVGKPPLAHFDAMATVLNGNRLMVIGGRGAIPGKAGEQILDAAEIAIPVA